MCRSLLHSVWHFVPNVENRNVAQTCIDAPGEPYHLEIGFLTAVGLQSCANLVMCVCVRPFYVEGKHRTPADIHVCLSLSLARRIIWLSDCQNGSKLRFRIGVCMRRHPWGPTVAFCGWKFKNCMPCKPTAIIAPFFYTVFKPFNCYSLKPTSVTQMLWPKVLWTGPCHRKPAILWPLAPDEAWVELSSWMDLRWKQDFRKHVELKEPSTILNVLQQKPVGNVDKRKQLNVQHTFYSMPILMKTRLQHGALC